MRRLRVFIWAMLLACTSIVLEACQEVREVNARKLVSKTEVSKESYPLEVYPESKGKTFATFKGRDESYPVYKMSNNQRYKYYIKVDSIYFLFNLQ